MMKSIKILLQGLFLVSSLFGVCFCDKSDSNRVCKSLGVSTGKYSAAESCKNIIKSCLGDGKIIFKKQSEKDRQLQKEVSFYGDCALQFTQGCLETCNQNAIFKSNMCHMWTKSSTSALFRVSGNRCQLESAKFYLESECKRFCASEASNIQKFSYNKDFQVEKLSDYVSNFVVQPLKWIPE